MTSRAIVPMLLACVLVTNARLCADDEPVTAKYYGVDPWGQLGSQRGYFLVGASLHLVL